MQNIQLSKNFDLEELTVTNTGLKNTPTDKQIEKLKYVASFLLQPIREKWGPTTVSSGFRCLEVNRAVGSTSTNSQHLKGEASDFVISGCNTWEVYRWIIEKSGIVFGQCIYEKKKGKEWIHISLPRLGRIDKEALIIIDKDRKTYTKEDHGY